MHGLFAPASAGHRREPWPCCACPNGLHPCRAMAAASRLPAGLAVHLTSSIAGALDGSGSSLPQPERQQPENRQRQQTRAATLLLQALEALAAAEQQPGGGSEGAWDKSRTKVLAQRVRTRGESIIKRARRDASLRQRMLDVQPGTSAAELILQAEAGAPKQAPENSRGRRDAANEAPVPLDGRPAKRARQGAQQQDEQQQDRQQQHVHSTSVQQEDMPPAFVAWLAENHIDPRVYTLNAELPRYVRRNPRLQQPSAAEISEQLGARRVASPLPLPRLTAPYRLRLPCVCRAGGTELRPVTWLPRGPHGWYSLDCNVKIAGCDAYRRGYIYGMDASSAAAAIALAAVPGDRILDLCCAPATKTCLLADALSVASTDGASRLAITAVDVSSDRLKVARNIMGKYGLEVIAEDSIGAAAAAATVSRKAKGKGKGALWPGDTALVEEDGTAVGGPGYTVPIRMFCADGTQFNEPPPSPSCGDGAAGAEVSMSAGAPADGGLRKGQTKIPAPDNTPPLCCAAPPSGMLYTRVLVDAECTHDGSLKHVAKFATQWGWSTFERRVLAPEKIAQVIGLQRALLWNGFRLLEPCHEHEEEVASGGGRPSSALVYSTCSLSRSQNEDVVSWLLGLMPDARVVPIDQEDCRLQLYGTRTAQPTEGAEAEAAVAAWPCKESAFLPHTLRFDPYTSGTSGLFVAKIIKLKR